MKLQRELPVRRLDVLLRGLHANAQCSIMTNFGSFTATVVVGALVGLRFGRVIVGLYVRVIVRIRAAPTASRSGATRRTGAWSTRIAALLLEVVAGVRVTRVAGASGGAVVASVRRVRGSSFAGCVAVVRLQESEEDNI